MAILTEGGNKCEVRIKRIPQNTYFKEHVKVGGREKPDAIQCDRYIVGEQGQKYTVQITIKKGFRWDNFEHVAIAVFLTGRREPIALSGLHKSNAVNIGKADVTVELDCVNSSSLSDFHGAPFSFQSLTIGMFHSWGAFHLFT
jgi:hypothetical protein